MMDMRLDSLKNLSSKQKLLAFGFAVILVSGLFIWFVFIPKSDTIAMIEKQVTALNEEINVHRVKVRRLDVLKKEYMSIQAQLKEQKEQLPSEAEIEILLSQVSELGGKSGLDFKLWRPGSRKENASGLYVEIPVSVEVAGGYHSVGAFFDKISKLKRIINVSNIQMAAPVIEQNRVTIQTQFFATAFASTEKRSGAAQVGGVNP